MFKLNRLEKTIFLLVGLLGPALVLFWWLQSWAVLSVAGFILGVGGAYIWRPQGRDPRNGRFISKILVLSASLLALFWTGCGADGYFTLPQDPGAINNKRESQRWTFAPPQPPVVFVIPGSLPATQPSAQSPQIIVVQPSGSPMPATIETNKESTTVTQPENAAGEASLVTGNSGGGSGGGASGGTKASIPPSYAPPKPPAAATPTQKALGGLVWVGAALVVLGVLGIGLRFLPWTAALGTVIPIGVSVLVALSGGLLIAYATVLAEAPWWVIGLCIAGVVAVGYLVATRHNWQIMFGGKSAPVTPAPAPTPVSAPIPAPAPTPTITT